MRARSLAARLLALLLFVVLAACGGLRVAEPRLPAGLEWPPGEPRIVLERVIEVQRGGGVLGALLGGGRQRAALFVRPYGLAWQGDDLLVADPGARRVLRIEGDGHISMSTEGALGAPVFLADCREGVLASDSETGRVALLARDLRLARWVAEGLERPTGVACDGDELYVVETAGHRVTVLHPGGQQSLGKRGAQPGAFNFPAAIAFHQGQLFVGDTLNFRVQRIDASTGRSRGSFGQLGDAPGEMPRIKGVAVDSEGKVWVSDAQTDRVSIYDPDGTLLLSLGGRGDQPGRFSFPAGIAAHADGRVAVADSFNRRIQVFRVLVRGEAGR